MRSEMRILYFLLRTSLSDLVRCARAESKSRRWKRSDRQTPPPQRYKAETLQKYARTFGTTTLIETGTYLGETVHALRKTFSRIYSIEIDYLLYSRARERFAQHPHITILHGDSARMLPRVLSEVDTPCLFWLDGHYSGGVTGMGDEISPIMSELRHVLANPIPGHVILIDDARLFGRQDGYPGLEEVETLVASDGAGRTVTVSEDMILIR